MRGPLRLLLPRCPPSEMGVKQENGRRGTQKWLRIKLTRWESRGRDSQILSIQYKICLTDHRGFPSFSSFNSVMKVNSPAWEYIQYSCLLKLQLCETKRKTSLKTLGNIWRADMVSSLGMLQTKSLRLPKDICYVVVNSQSLKLPPKLFMTKCTAAKLSNSSIH